MLRPEYSTAFNRDVKRCQNGVIYFVRTGTHSDLLEK